MRSTRPAAAFAVALTALSLTTPASAAQRPAGLRGSGRRGDSHRIRPDAAGQHRHGRRGPA